MGRICCVLDEILGDATEAVKFTTVVAEPDQPMPPRLQSKTKTSLQLKWNVSFVLKLSKMYIYSVLLLLVDSAL